MLNFGRVVTYSNLGKFGTKDSRNRHEKMWENSGQDVGHCMTSAVSFAQDLLRPHRIWKIQGGRCFLNIMFDDVSARCWSLHDLGCILCTRSSKAPQNLKNSGWPVFSKHHVWWCIGKKVLAKESNIYLLRKPRWQRKNHRVSIQHTPSNVFFFFSVVMLVFPGVPSPNITLKWLETWRYLVAKYELVVHRCKDYYFEFWITHFAECVWVLSVVAPIQ